MAKQSKRRSERLPVSLPVQWIKRTGPVMTTAADMNLHGMFLRAADLSVRPGELLQLRVSVQNVELDMFVIVRFVGRTDSGVGIGVEIFVMEERQSNLWTNYYRAESARMRRLTRTVAAAAR